MTQAVNCPSCRQQIEIDDSPQQQEVERLKAELNRPRTHEEIASSLPKGVNYSPCPDGNCGKKIENPHSISHFKQCPACSSNTVPKSSPFCPTCGIDENSQKFRDDYDEWNESDVDINGDKGW